MFRQAPFGIPLILMLSGLLPPMVTAHVEVVSDTLCVNAVRALLAAPPDRSVPRALSTLVTCPESGPPAVAGLWASRTTSVVELGSLSEVSARFRDRRVYMAVREVVLDRNRETPHRLHALATLATHADRCFALYIHTPPTGRLGHMATSCREGGTITSVTAEQNRSGRPFARRFLRCWINSQEQSPNTPLAWWRHSRPRSSNESGGRSTAEFLPAVGLFSGGSTHLWPSDHDVA
jgi:hypothetical protein